MTELTQVPAPRCIHLYSGAMAIHGESFEESTDYQSGLSGFTCNQTGRPLGPDSAPVGMKPCCNAERECYEEY